MATYHGKRKTPQREAVRDAILAAGRPLSAEEILARARKDVPALGLATVYRHLRYLLDQNQVITVEIAGSTPRFEPAELAHHHHFHCRACDKVFEIVGCPFHGQPKAPPGFQVDSHEVTLSGTCERCGRKASDGRVH